MRKLAATECSLQRSQAVNSRLWRTKYHIIHETTGKRKRNLHPECQFTFTYARVVRARPRARLHRTERACISQRDNAGVTVRDASISYLLRSHKRCRHSRHQATYVSILMGLRPFVLCTSSINNYDYVCA